MTSSFGDQKSPMMTSANNVGEGWHPILRGLEEQLNEIDPNFELLQVKEKFGGLRYYAGTGVTERTEEFHNRIREAEALAELICEECGKPGKNQSGNTGWLKTLCDSCRAEHDAKYSAS